MKRDLVFFIIFFVLLGALFSLPARPTNALAGSIRDIFAAPQISLRPAGEWFRAFTRGPAELWRENQRLRIQLEELRNELRQSKPLQEENQELRALLQLKSSSRYPLLAAQLLLRDVNGWWQMARIDKGAADGVELNLPVISPEGVVGQVAGVSPRTADVLFLTNPELRISVRLARSDVFGIVRGQGFFPRGAARCRLDFIMKNAEVSRAEEVVTSGLGGVYPPGLVVGYIENVQTDASGLFQAAEVIPAADLQALDIVFVVFPARAGAASEPTKRR